MDDDLEEARRRWGDHVTAVHTFPPVPDGKTCPFAFGDIVHRRGGEVGVVRVPDQGGHLCGLLHIDGTPGDYSFPDNPKPLISSWSLILRVIGSHADLPESYRQALEPYRRCVVLGGMHWDTGVFFLDDTEQDLLRTGRWSEFDLGTSQLVARFFGTFSEAEGRDAAESYRLLVHTDDDWNTWTCHGPASSGEIQALVETLGERYDVPREIRRGVYEVDPETMTKYEVFRGYQKIQERHFCVGQGEECGRPSSDAAP